MIIRKNPKLGGQVLKHLSGFGQRTFVTFVTFVDIQEPQKNLGSSNPKPVNVYPAEFIVIRQIDTYSEFGRMDKHSEKPYNSNMFFVKSHQISFLLLLFFFINHSFTIT